MHIGEIAARSGCRADTVRYYERVGLLPQPTRGANNYRRYGGMHLERLALIRHCRSLGMSLPEVRALLKAMEQPDGNCDTVNALLDEHIAHVAGRITELSNLRSELEAIRRQCEGTKRAKACGILAQLKKADSRVAAGAGHGASCNPNRPRSTAR